MPQHLKIDISAADAITHDATVGIIIEMLLADIAMMGDALETGVSVVQGLGDGAEALGDAGNRPPNPGCPFCLSS